MILTWYDQVHGVWDFVSVPVSRRTTVVSFVIRFHNELHDECLVVLLGVAHGTQWDGVPVPWRDQSFLPHQFSVAHSATPQLYIFTLTGDYGRHQSLGDKLQPCNIQNRYPAIGITKSDPLKHVTTARWYRRSPGAVSVYRCRLTSIWIPMLKTSTAVLSLSWESPYMEKRSTYWNGPRSLSVFRLNCFTNGDVYNDPGLRSKRSRSRSSIGHGYGRIKFLFCKP